MIFQENTWNITVANSFFSSMLASPFWIWYVQMFATYEWAIYIIYTYDIWHTKLCELTDLETWGILIAVVAHLPPWRMAATWADYGEGPCCVEGDEPICPIQFTRSNTRYSKSPCLFGFSFLQWDLPLFRRIFLWGTYRRHARLVGSCGMMCWEIPEENETATSIQKSLANFHESADDFIPALPKNPSRSPEKTWSFRLGQMEGKGVMSPNKEIARSHTVRCSKDDEKRGGGEIIDLFKAFQAFQPRWMMVWPAKSQISWTTPAG